VAAGRLRSGEWVAGLAAVVLLVALFGLHWYAVAHAGFFTYRPLSHRPPLAGLTGWHAVPTLRWFVLVTALLGLGLAVTQARSRGAGLPVTLDLIGMPVAGLTTILLTIRLATTSAPLRFGAVVGLAAAAGVTFGAFRALRTEQGWDAGPAHPERPIEIIELSSRA
jgi:hypothetical protein